MSDAQVLIVGAGPTGLTLACELQRHGVPFRIIDKSAAPSEHSKAFAVHARTMELFDGLGVIDTLLKRGSPSHGLSLYADGKHVTTLNLEGKIQSKYPFIQIIAQSDTERVLIEHLEANGASVERNTELVQFTDNREDSVAVQIQSADGEYETFEVSYLVGCDGAHSTVRKGLGLNYEGAPYPNQWLLADATFDWDYPQNEMAIFSHTAGVTAFFPLDRGRGRLMFQLPETTVDEDLGEATLDDVLEHLQARSIAYRQVTDPNWISYFRLHHRMVDRYRVGRVFVAGDAAHIHSPVGGQGMNIGIQDAFNLGWKLAGVCKGRAFESILDSYEAERRKVDEGVVNFTHVAMTAAGMTNPVYLAVRNAVMKQVTKLNAVTQRVLTTVSQVEHHYRKSPIVAQSWPTPIGTRSDVHPGERVPDFPLEKAFNRRVSDLYELFTGAEHELLVLAGKGGLNDKVAYELGRALTVVQIRYRDLIEPHLIAVDRIPEGLPECESSWLDPDGALHDALGATVPTLYLIRPDGYVAYRCQPASEESLTAYLEGLFIGP